MEDFFSQLLLSRVGSLSLHGGLFLVVVGVKGGVPKVGLRLGVENGLHLLKHLLQHRDVELVALNTVVK